MADELRKQLEALLSESRNPATQDIDLLDSYGIVERLHQEDLAVHQAITLVLSDIAAAVDLVVKTLANNGRLVYLGAGTSGRLGVLDAVECVPTFGLEPGRITAVLAGGERAMFESQEGIEDRPDAAQRDLEQVELSSNDVVLGIAASGRTPYVLAGLDYARRLGAATMALSCNPDALIARAADIAILPIVGPETPAGSSRMKAGTAQKQILNMISTASMIRLGKCYQNLMIDLKPSNAKLRARSLNMIMMLTGADEDQALQALSAAHNEVKTAVYMLMASCSASEARQALSISEGFLRQALQRLNA